MRSARSVVRGRRVRWAAAAAACLLGSVACPTPRGGWDAAALDGQVSLEGLRGHRLTDMVPFPAPESGGIALVACRWPLDRPLPVRAPRGDWPRQWSEAAVNAVAAAVPDLELVLESPTDHRAESARGIDVGLVSDRASDREAGPLGLGDTLVRCDVSPSLSGMPARGVVEHAEIRLRRARRDLRGRVVALEPGQAVGAMMHELAHALGFAGHPTVGRSILVLREDRLVRAGAGALAGTPWRDATLEALYRLAPGQPLGRRPLSERSLGWLARIRERVGERSDRASSGPWASVGDREARLEWRDGQEQLLRLRFPAWRDQLERGRPLIALPDRATRERLRRSTSAGVDPTPRDPDRAVVRAR